MSTDTIPVAPSLLLWPELRERLITYYAEIADTERGLCRPVWEQHARRQIARLEAESPLTLAEMLEAEHVA